MAGYSFTDHAEKRLYERNIAKRSVRVAIDKGSKGAESEGEVKYILGDKLTVVVNEDEKTIITAWHGGANSNQLARSTPPKWWVDYHNISEGFICPNCEELRTDFFEASDKIASKCCSHLFKLQKWIDNTPERIQPE